MVWTEQTLVTQRLCLRAWCSGDEPVFRQLLTDPDVCGHLAGPADPTTIDRLIAVGIGDRVNEFCVADRHTDTALGCVRLEVELHGEPEVSCEFVPRVWGVGLGAEALTAFLAWVWTSADTDSVIAVTESANTRARRLLERLGFLSEREFVEWGAVQTRYRACRPGPQLGV